MPITGAQVLAFDVFGTVVDVRGSLIRELTAFGDGHGVVANWPTVADRWLLGYEEGTAAINDGARPWATVDELNRATLDQILADLGLPDTPDSEREELNSAWHRLTPWPDSLAGLDRLRQRFRVVTLANGNLTLLRDLQTATGLPWNELLSVESMPPAERAYKPDPAVYPWAIKQLQVGASEIVMVAAHSADLGAAQDAHMQTAYVKRPLELGTGSESDPPGPGDHFDLTANDFLDLADQLGT
jgi:2-haloacid dehalogenase